MAFTERRYELSDLTEVGGATSLTNNNAATFTTGLAGDAVSLVTASSQYLSVSDSAFNAVANTDPAEPFTIYGFFNLNAIGQNHGLAGQATSSYHVHVVSANVVRFRVNRVTGGNLNIDSTVSLSASEWYWFCGEYDPGDNYARLEVTPVSQAYRNLPVAVRINDATGLVSGTGPFTIGSISTANYADALIDGVGFRRGGLLSGDEKDFYFNGGTGRSHAAVDTLRATELYCYQEFSAGIASDGTSITVPVLNLVEGDIAIAMLTTDGNSSAASITAWDNTWTQLSDQPGPSTGTTFLRQRLFELSAPVSAADVSTETQVTVSWTTSQKGNLRVRFYRNCAGVNVHGTGALASPGTAFSSPSVTTTVDGCRVIVGIGMDTTVTTSVPTSTEQQNYDVNGSSGQVSTWYGSFFQASAGATTARAYTIGTFTHAVPFTIAMEPAAAGGATVDAAAADGLTLSDTAAGSIAALVSASDGITLSDAAAATLSQLAAALDGVTLTDTATVSLVLSAAAADGLNLSDVAAVVALYTAAASEGLQFSDSATASILLQVTASDGFTFSDGATYPTGAAYVAATVTIANAIAASVTLQNAISATVTLKPD